MELFTHGNWKMNDQVLKRKTHSCMVIVASLNDGGKFWPMLNTNSCWEF